MASRFRKSPNMLLKAGVPMILLVVGGSFFLSNFMETHMELKDKHMKSTPERQFDLEEENRQLLKKLNIDDFKLSRIPRPDELDPKTQQPKKP